MVFSQPEEFRRKIEHALHAIGRESTRHGYDDAATEDAQFAVAAFIDESVSPIAEAGHGSWDPLQRSRFNTLDAEEEFFDRLASNMQRSDSLATADVLEVFVLCLQLGFQGKHADNEAQLSRLIDEATGRVRKIRQTIFRVSPEGDLQDEKAIAVPVRKSRRQRLLLRALIALPVVMVMFWFGFRLHLNFKARSVRPGTNDVVSMFADDGVLVARSEVWRP